MAFLLLLSVEVASSSRLAGHGMVPEELGNFLLIANFASKTEDFPF